MARAKAAAKEKSEFVELVSPDGDKETPTNLKRDVELRFRGYLPAEQAKLDAPEPSDSGSAAAQLGGPEKTAGTNGSN